MAERSKSTGYRKGSSSPTKSVSHTIGSEKAKARRGDCYFKQAGTLNLSKSLYQSEKRKELSQTTEMAQAVNELIAKCELTGRIPSAVCKPGLYF
jgi:hypothetical protein